jgi:hypothetical protein
MSVDGGKTRVKCMWCNHIMPLHTTNAAPVANKGVKICTGVVPKAHRDRCQDLHEKKLGKANQKASEFSDVFAQSNHVLASNKNKKQLYLLDCRRRLKRLQGRNNASLM